MAQLAKAPAERREVRFGTMRGRIHMKPGWDRPLTEDEFLSGEFEGLFAGHQRGSPGGPVLTTDGMIPRYASERFRVMQ